LSPSSLRMSGSKDRTQPRPTPPPRPRDPTCTDRTGQDRTGGGGGEGGGGIKRAKRRGLNGCGVLCLNCVFLREQVCAWPAVGRPRFSPLFSPVLPPVLVRYGATSRDRIGVGQPYRSDLRFSSPRGGGRPKVLGTLKYDKAN